MITLKMEDGVYYVTIDGKTEEHQMLCKALASIWEAHGKEVRGEDSGE